MLAIEGLSAHYGPIAALDSVSLEVRPGRITAVLGANGAGKTTLLQTISGLVRPSSGTVRLDGTDITRLPAHRMTRTGLAHVPEGRGVIGQLTVAENLRLGEMGRADRSRRPDLGVVYELFPVLGDRRGIRASALSGGERQMLVIGRALLSTPRVLLLDEPSLGLAPKIVAQIFALIRDLVASRGLTVLLVEQNARSALSIADHGLILNLGRVVAEGEPDALAADDDLRRAYLGF